MPSETVVASAWKRILEKKSPNDDKIEYLKRTCQANRLPLKLKYKPQFLFEVKLRIKQVKNEKEK